MPAAPALNLWLALRLALRSLSHRKMVALATMLGVAIGVCVVNTVLIVDANTARTSAAEQSSDADPRAPDAQPVAAEQDVGGKSFSITIQRNRPGAGDTFVPTQRGGSGSQKGAAATRLGEED